MAITRLGSTFLSNYGNGARTLAVPGSYAAGDLILAVSFTNAAEGGPTVNGDSRFTLLALAETLVGDSTTSNNRGAIWYAFATSASEADVTFPDESPVQAVGLITYSGVDSVALITELESADMPDGTTLKWGGGTVTSGSTIFGVGVKRYDVSTSTWALAPSGTNYTHTAIIDQVSSNRNNGQAHIAFDGVASSTTLGDLTATVADSTVQGSALIQLIEASGGGDVTGTMATTESGSDTASASGTVAWPGLTGTMATTEAGSDTAAFAGTVTDPGIVGSLAAQEVGSDTASASGTVVWPARTGTMAATETGSDTAAFSGIVTDPGIIGSLAAQEVGNDVASASGTVAWPARTGTMAAQESGADVASFSGIVTAPGIVGSMAATESGSDVASASGTVAWAGRTGSLAAQESGRDAMSATGGVLVSGAMAVTEAGQDVFAGYEAALSRRREREASASDPRGLIMLSDSSGSVYRRNGVGGKGSIGRRQTGKTGVSRE